MQFLYPQFLWGLLALFIPLIVHLFNFRRTKKVYFSNVALLKTVETKTASFRKLKNFLTMLARMLFIAALVLAFAQPIKRAGDYTGSPVGINGIYLDNSQSMQNTIKNKKLLDLAVIKIDELLTLLDRMSNLQLTTNDFDNQDQFLTTSSKIKDRLTTTGYSETGRTFTQIYKRQKSIADKHNTSAANHFFWFSDFQKSTAGNLSELKTDTLDTIHLVPVAGSKTNNVFVDSLWLEVPFVREMQNNALNIKVYNSGNQAVEKLPLRLFVDDIQISTSSVDLPANAFGTAKFNFTVEQRGIHKGRVTVDDQPITFDNDYYFTLDASPSIEILHLYSSKSLQDYVGKLFSDDSLFTFHSYPFDNFDTGLIKNTDLLVLEGINNLDGERKAAIDQFLDQGGNVVLIPGKNPSQISLQQFLATYGIQGLLVDNHLPKPETLLEIERPSRQSPFFEDVFERGIHNTQMSLPKVNPKISWSGIAEKILTLKDGKAFLTRTKTGDGNLYIFASPFSKEYGDFAEHALFVPTLFKMAYMSGKTQRLSYNFSDGFIQIHMPNAPKNAVYKLRNKQFEIIPEQSMRGNTLILTLPKSSELEESQSLGASIFDLTINDKTVKSIAINHSKTESYMDTYSPEELKEILGDQKNIKIYQSINDGDFIRSFRESALDKSYWKYFIVAALSFLLVEILLNRLLKA